MGWRRTGLLPRRVSEDDARVPRSAFGHAARHALSEQTRRRAAIARRSLVAADALAAVLAPLLVSVLFHTSASAATLLTAPVVILIGKVASLYDRDEARLRKSTLEEVPSLFQLSGICALILWLGDGIVFADDLNRGAVVALWVSLFGGIVAGRLAARFLAARMLPAERCLVIGDPGATAGVAEKIAGRRAELVGRLPLVERRGDAAHTQLCAEFEEAVCRSGANRVIVVPGVHGETEATMAAVSKAQEMGVYVSIVPRMFEVVGSSVEFDHVDGMTLLGVHRFGLSRSSLIVKRAVDLVGASIGLLILAPLFAVVAAAIRLDSRGPIFFRQPRMGHGGQPFTMLKFRTMHEGADRVRAELEALNHAGEGLFKVAGDPRVTRVGRLLRRSSLDELPQIFNVLLGDMSLVGPRPLVTDEDALVQGIYRMRLHLTPGMTGPWQILGSTRVPMDEMVGIDYLYVANWSLWADIKLLLRTVPHMLARRGL